MLAESEPDHAGQDVLMDIITSIQVYERALIYCAFLEESGHLLRSVMLCLWF